MGMPTQGEGCGHCVYNPSGRRAIHHPERGVSSEQPSPFVHLEFPSVHTCTNLYSLVSALFNPVQLLRPQLRHCVVHRHCGVASTLSPNDPQGLWMTLLRAGLDGSRLTKVRSPLAGCRKTVRGAS